MYSERMLTGDLSPPVTGNNVDDWPDQAPFVFEDHRPSPVSSLMLGLRHLPSIGLLVLAVAAGLISAMTVILNAERAVSPWTLSPGIALGMLALVNMGLKRMLSERPGAPADGARVSALKRRAARHDVQGPMVDAQARTQDCWRVGHVREAHAVLDRMQVMACTQDSIARRSR